MGSPGRYREVRQPRWSSAVHAGSRDQESVVGQIINSLIGCPPPAWGWPHGRTLAAKVLTAPVSFPKGHQCSAHSMGKRGGSFPPPFPPFSIERVDYRRFSKLAFGSSWAQPWPHRASSSPFLYGRGGLSQISKIGLRLVMGPAVAPLGPFLSLSL